MPEAAPPEAVEYRADPDKICLPLEEEVFALATPDAVQTPAGLYIEDKDQVGFDRETLVQAPDAGRINPLASLIGDRREIVAVEDGNLLGGQGRPDVFPDVLPPVLDEKVEFLLRRQAAFRLGPPLS